MKRVRQIIRKRKITNEELEELKNLLTIKRITNHGSSSIFEECDNYTIVCNEYDFDIDLCVIR